MKLFLTIRSPFARKVRVVAAHHNIPLELAEVELRPTPPELLARNPLGKVPCLVLEDGTAIFDSPVIVEYLDGIGTSTKLLPTAPLARARNNVLHAAADGMLDAAVAIIYEHLRPEDKRSADIIAKHHKTMLTGADWLAAHLAELQGSLHMGALAAAVTLDYLRHRMADYGLEQGWTKSQPALMEWLEATLANPIFAGTTPAEWAAYTR